MRKSQFSKMRYLNPGFGGHWDMSGILFVEVIFLTLQKKSFGPNFFFLEFHARVQFWQNGTFEPAHEIQIFFWSEDFFEAL